MYIKKPTAFRWPVLNVDNKEEKATVLISNHPICNYYKRKKYTCNKCQAKLHVTS